MAVGFVAGAILSASTTVYASEKISALFRPIHVYFDNGLKVERIEITALNYNNTLYVPLRTISENMDASVSWRPGDSNNKEQVTIKYASAKRKNFEITDPKGVVSIGELTIPHNPESAIKKNQVSGLIHLHSSQYVESVVTVKLDFMTKEGTFIASGTVTLTMKPDQTLPFHMTVWGLDPRLEEVTATISEVSVTSAAQPENIAP